MMISNSLGSNVYNVLVALGLPWFIFSFIRGGVVIDTTGLLVFTIMVLATLIAVVAIIVASRLVLTWVDSIPLLLIYVVFIVLALLFSFPTGNPVINLAYSPNPDL